MAKLIEYAIAALASLISYFGIDYIFGKTDNLEMYRAVGVAVVSGVLFAILGLFNNYLKDIYGVRRFLDNRSKFEGTYLERITDYDKDNPIGDAYAIFTIEYSGHEKDSYSMKGFSYKEDGTLVASWHSHYMEIDVANATIDYSYYGDYNSEIVSVWGIGYMTFNKTKNYLSLSAPYVDLPHSGMGLFIEDGKRAVKKTIEFARLNRQDVKRICPHIEEISPSDREREIIRSYVNMINGNIGKGIQFPNDINRSKDGTMFEGGKLNFGRLLAFTIKMAIFAGIVVLVYAYAFGFS